VKWKTKNQNLVSLREKSYGWMICQSSSPSAEKKTWRKCSCNNTEKNGVDNDVAAPHNRLLCVLYFCGQFISYPDSPFPHNHSVLCIQPLARWVVGTKWGHNLICLTTFLYFVVQFRINFGYVSSVERETTALEWFFLDIYVCDKSSWINMLLPDF
jgi:hypothetical protein